MTNKAQERRAAQQARPALSREQVELGAARVIKWLLIAFFLLTTAFPFYWMLNLSVRPIGDVLQYPTRLIPTWEQISNFSESYRAVLFDFRFTTFIGNSLLVSLITVTLTLLLAIPGAYAVTRLNFRLKALMSWGILLVYMFPGIVIGIPLFVVYSQLGLRGNLPGLMVIYMSGTLPVALYMLRSYFQTLPAELEEAALIDGCNHLSTIWRVVLPLSVPAVASVALYTFMIAWNEILFAILFLTDTPASWTLPLGLRQLDTQEVPRTYLMAGSVIITVPVIALFFFFERFLTRGLTAGAVKG
ncbi:MAG: carbohydrate ABC transporter permease [Chloroflexi bacterium]|nr:carbohydrate ABC transporter permease [Chloroflexota bacterium]